VGARGPGLSLSFMFSRRDGSGYLSSKTEMTPDIGPALVGIGVFYPKARQYLGLEALHLKGLRVGQVIIA